MIDLSILEEIRPSKDPYANQRFLDLEIGDDAYTLTNLKTEENRLQASLHRHQNTLQKRKHENVILKSDTKSYRKDENFDLNSGGFFPRLRSAEAEYERVSSQKEGLTSTVSNLRDVVKAAKLKNKKLTQKIEELHEKYDNATERTRHYVNLFNDTNDSLQAMSQNVMELENECELIKSKIKKKAEELKRFSPTDAATLAIQRKTIENELKERQTYFADLKFKEKQLKSHNSVSIKKRNRDLKSRSSTTNWMSERMSFIAKIKKAREERAALQKFERSTQRLTEMTEKQKDEFNFTEDELKISLLTEIKSLEFHKSQFYEETMETEMEYTEELQSQLEEINQSAAQIQNFKASTLDLLKRQEEVASMSDRLEILRDELTDIRSELM